MPRHYRGQRGRRIDVRGERNRTAQPDQTAPFAANVTAPRSHRTTPRGDAATAAAELRTTYDSIVGRGDSRRLRARSNQLVPNSSGRARRRGVVGRTAYVDRRLGWPEPDVPDGVDD